MRAATPDANGDRGPRTRGEAGLRLHCHDFQSSDVDALRSLLRLLGNYLPQPWCIGADAPSIVFVNLDRRETEPRYAGARLVGCALKPRLHPPGTLHRPFRSAEVLALLSECGPQTQGRVADGQTQWSYALHRWPAEFEHLPRSAVRVMAAISRRRRTAAEIEIRTGLPVREIEELLTLLQPMEIIERLVERQSSPAPPSVSTNSGLRGLAARVGRVLGFAA